MRAGRLGFLPLLLGALLSGACRWEPVGPPAAAARTAPGIRFTRITEVAGIRFRHESGASGRKYFPEQMGAGCAFFDYDNDGWLDLFLVNGGRLPGWKGREPPVHHLYRNNRDGTFTDVTAASGIRGGQYGIGCCAGDYDGDGFLDLYVAGFDGNVLYRNNGDGTFTDVTERAGVRGSGLCSSCAMGDYDGDGDLDLYVCRYVRYSIAENVPCYQMQGHERKLVMCRQTVYDAAPDLFYRNNGDGTFTEVTRRVGLDVPPGRGLGVLFADFDDDGRPDLFVANDLDPNFLFRNRGGRFREEGMQRGIALDAAGHPQASMGVDAADVNGDGLLDLAATNFTGEYTVLYRQTPQHLFQDVSASLGLVEATSRVVGFGLGLEDLDRDGWPDIFMANGHVSEDAEKFYEGIGMAQPKIVLRNEEGRRFARLASPWSDAVTARLAIGRGAAFGDFDNDGDVDVLVNNLDDTPDLLRNDTPASGSWLSVRLRPRGRNRFAVGARVTVRTGDHLQVREVRSGGSYASQNDLRLFFGLGSRPEADEVTVRWPDGSVERWRQVRGNRQVTLVQGQGSA